MSSPVIAAFASLARVDASCLDGRPALERVELQLAHINMLGHCLAGSLDGHDSHREPRADAGRFTTEHRVGLKWRAILFGDRNAQFLLYRNLQLETHGVFDKAANEAIQ